WLALAFNLPGFFIGMGCVDGNWFFPLVHLVSVTVESLFCAGCVVLGYQLCIRWFGRERLEGLMTLAQVFIGIAAVLGGQIVPRVMLRYDKAITATLETWWVCLLPPAWFAGLNDAIAGQGDAGSWGLAGIGIVCTGLVLWLAFGKLAGDYDAGLRALQETSAPRPKKRSRRQWLQLLINTPLLRWWLGNSVERASFHLTSAYLLRDRDVKLRIYPGIAPTLALPLIILFGSRNPDDAGSFFIALSGMFLGTTAMLGMNLLQFSQQWQASDLFRVAPVHGPGQFCLGASRAVMTFLAVPLVMLIGVVAWASRGNFELLLLLVPGILTLPVFALFPCIGGKAIPLSHPTEEAKSARQGLRMFSAFIIASIMAAIASSAWSAGWFVCFLLCETAVVVVLRSMMRASLNRTQWSRLD
ncbi:MAG TPA: hypothetical protein PKA41_17965, partial [Verrucomicrobiota bacterium]|nr:hypothetical protein [Verrucomicrobiota bacterium]